MSDTLDTSGAVQAYLGGRKPDPAQQTRAGLALAVGTNPDLEAELRKVAQRTGVPVDTVRAYPEEMKKQAALVAADPEGVAQRFPRTAAFLSGVENAQVAHDDIENMGLFETLANSFARIPAALKAIGPAITATDRAEGLRQLNRIDELLAQGQSVDTIATTPLGVLGEQYLRAAPEQRARLREMVTPAMQRQIGESVRTLVAANAERNAIPLPGVVDRTMKAKTFGEALTEIGKDPLLFMAAIGPESLGTSLPGIIAAVPAGVVAGPLGAGATMGANSFVVDYGNSLVENLGNAGVDVNDPEAIRAALADPKILAEVIDKSGKHAGVVAAFDALSGGIAGKTLLPQRVAGKLVNRPLAQELANIGLQVPVQAGLGGAGEALGSVAAGEEVKPGAVLAEMFGEMFGTPGEVIGASGKRVYERIGEARRASQNAAVLEQLSQVAAASKVMARDADTFERFVEQATEGGPVTDVYIDAQTLAQSGVAEQIAQVSPSVAEQLPAALASGGQVRIPIAEYAARVAGTEFNQPLLEHLKTEPAGMSRAEAEEFMKNQAENLRTEVEQILAAKLGDPAFRQSTEAVRTNVLTQLNTVGRFTNTVNESYASMVGNFFAVQAAKMGVTPEALFARYPLRIQAENVVGGEVLSQGADQFDWSNPGGSGLKGSSVRTTKVGDTTIDYGVGRDGTAEIISVRTPQAKRGKGSARSALSSFLREADARGLSVKLQASSLDKKTSTAKLVEFYRSLGFEPTGVKINAVGDPEMVRPPQQLNQSTPSTNQTDTPEFKAWFGDSKVVDAEGKPLVVYHGTVSSFAQFSAKFQGAVTRATSSKSGFFFTSSPRTAESYANHGALVAPVQKLIEEADKASDRGNWDKYDAKIAEAETLEAELGDPANRGRGQNVMPVFLSMQNPLVIDAKGENPEGIGGIDPLIQKAKRAGHDGVIIRNFDDAANIANDNADHFIIFKDTQVKSATGNDGTFDANDPSILSQGTGNRGAFSPATNTITLLKAADLSTFLHEAGHFFLEVQFDMAAQVAQGAQAFGAETNNAAEQQLIRDAQTLLQWFGVSNLTEWYALDFEEKRGYHEQFARGFEAYLFEGKAPSFELQRIFQTFRTWLTGTYRQILERIRKGMSSASPEEIGKALDVQLSDEVRAVMDRMLATEEEIKLAEQGRSMMPLFTSPEQAGMTTEEFAAYQAQGAQATADAIEDVQARTLRDLAWTRNARGREIKRLQREAAALRREVEIEVRREVMSQPVYRAWQFLTRKLDDADKLPALERAKSDPNQVVPELDSLLTAIAKLGGLRKEDTIAAWGIDPKERPASGVFGKPVLRVEGGRSIDDMAEVLGELGYLPKDENGKVDTRDLEERFDASLRGTDVFSDSYDYAGQNEQRAGDQVANPAALGAGRIDLTELRTMGLPKEIVDLIQARRMTGKSGLHPDIAAEIVGGFTSGDELVRALADAEPPKSAIEGRVDARMLERHGELATPEAIERAADKAIHNEARGRFIATQANAMAKAAGQRKVLAPAAREFARNMIARLLVRNIRPAQYASAEVRAAKAAQAASAKGDLATAAAEARNQLVNHYATRAAYDAQEEVDSGLRYLAKFDKAIKGLDPDYADQIDQLLERFDLRKGVSLRAVDKRKTLMQWVESQREQGLEPDIPEALLDEAARKSYKDMSVEEFRGLVDSVKQIEHLGRLKNKLLTAKDQREFEAVKAELVASIGENANGRQADTRTPTTNWGRFKQGVLRFYTSHIKVSTWARIMDGGKDGGPVWEYLVRSANERGDNEATMRAEATRRLTEIMAPVFKLGKMGGKGQFFATIGRSLNRESRIAIALNSGNESNMQRLLGGEGWTVEQVMPVLQSLTAAEWQAVQAVWDHFESYRPEIAAKERRVYGKEPTWVEPRPFTIRTADGQSVEVRGGYYPVKYDPAASQRAEEHADAEGAKRQMQGAYTSATTRRSFTKTRAEEVKGRPLLYTLSGLYSGVNDVIHDLTWHEWLIDANRILRSKSIDSAIRNAYGPEVKRQFKEWVAGIAEGEQGATNAGEVALGRLRQGVSAAGLGFNAMSAALQVLGFTQSIVRVGPGWVGKGIAQYVASPLGAMREVNSKSEFMANRQRTRFRELNELRNKVQDESPTMAAIKSGTYFMMMRCQQMVDTPTWLGAYAKALSEGNDEARAISLADQSVIDAQGGGQTKDLAGIERGGPALKLFTVFYSFMNTAFNLGVAQTMTANTPAKRGKLAADYLLLYVVPPAMGYVLKAALTPGDDNLDDPEKMAKELAAEQISYLMGMMVVVREFGEAIKMLTGADDNGRDYQGPAGLRLVGDTVKLAKQVNQGEFDDAFRKAAINVVGDVTGLPAAQANRTITGVQALAEGKTANPASIAFGYQEKR